MRDGGKISLQGIVQKCHSKDRHKTTQFTLNAGHVEVNIVHVGVY